MWGAQPPKGGLSPCFELSVGPVVDQRVLEGYKLLGGYLKQVQFHNPVTHGPTLCSADNLDVDFIKGGWGHRSGLAESHTKLSYKMANFTGHFLQFFFPSGRRELFLLDIFYLLA